MTGSETGQTHPSGGSRLEPGLFTWVVYGCTTLLLIAVILLAALWRHRRSRYVPDSQQSASVPLNTLAAPKRDSLSSDNNGSDRSDVIFPLPASDSMICRHYERVSGDYGPPVYIVQEITPQSPTNIYYKVWCRSSADNPRFQLSGTHSGRSRWHDASSALVSKCEEKSHDTDHFYFRQANASLIFVSRWSAQNAVQPFCFVEETMGGSWCNIRYVQLCVFRLFGSVQQMPVVDCIQVQLRGICTLLEEFHFLSTPYFRRKHFTFCSTTFIWKSVTLLESRFYIKKKQKKTTVYNIWAQTFSWLVNYVTICCLCFWGLNYGLDKTRYFLAVT